MVVLAKAGATTGKIHEKLKHLSERQITSKLYRLKKSTNVYVADSREYKDGVKEGYVRLSM